MGIKNSTLSKDKQYYLEGLTDIFPESPFDIPYLSEQIIPYIGNKRKLLPLIGEALLRVFPEGFRGKVFLDLFAGSGIVSRYARYLGFETLANDWEYYSFLLSYAYLKVNKRDIPSMYGAMGGLNSILYHLNTLPPPDREKEYIARYFCPRDDKNPDYKTERLFYTRYNGLIIDKIRNEIERLYPEGEIKESEALFREKTLLLALLIQQAATHTNTSGVFKACHKGFGGFSRDALSRILKPLSLPYPVLIDSEQLSQVFMEDANSLIRRDNILKRNIDVTYIDPPYNQHQYGSNYHMLNTIALWDKLPLKELISLEGKEKDRAGIRRDWVKTRSNYCYREKALAAFKDLIYNTDSPFILVSYSTDGIIPIKDTISICSEKGKVGLATNEYLKYPGGKQSINRSNTNIEFVIIIDSNKKTTHVDLEDLRNVITERMLKIQMKRNYSKNSLERYFMIDRKNERLGYRFDSVTLWIQTRGFFNIDEKGLGLKIDNLNLPEDLNKRMKRNLVERLKECECRDRVHELDTLFDILEEKMDNGRYYMSLIPNILKKIAHKKYREIFLLYLKRVKDLKVRIPEIYKNIEGKIIKIGELANKRFNG